MYTFVYAHIHTCANRRGFLSTPLPRFQRTTPQADTPERLLVFNAPEVTERVCAAVLQQ